jgi:hypothetical protein
VIPWLHLAGGLLAFLVLALSTAADSELGALLSPGESPLFAWARARLPAIRWACLAFLLSVAGLQRLAWRHAGQPAPPGLPALVGVELAAIGWVAAARTRGGDGALAWGQALLQASILLQALVTLWRVKASAWHLSIRAVDLGRGRHGLFLGTLFLLAALPAAFDPAWQRLHAHAHLDSRWEAFLSRALPGVLSGVTGLWFGVGIVGILAGFGHLWRRLDERAPRHAALAFLPFLAIAGLFAATGLAALFSAIDWELSGLRLKGAALPLFVLLCGGGGAVSWACFCRLAAHAPRLKGRSLVGVIGLALGAALLAPLTWWLTRPGAGRWSWRALCASAVLGSLGLASYVVFGDLFDPWFTVLSYVKGIMLKAACVAAAGGLALMVEGRAFRPGRPSPGRRGGMRAAAACLAGLLPFAALERVPATKVAVLQFNELSMVDATYARAVAGVLGLGRWVRLGQAPGFNGRPHPWPPPWTLEKTAPSRLPEGFNLIVIVVDALRGDAFHSAGYPRNLTPFLDRWAREEAVSFRRAYSQGGGTFAAFPFLVGGRSRFALYGAGLDRENLYLRIAQAEGIRRLMVVKASGLRAIFPPDLPVIELGGPHPRDDGRSVPAEAVFGWAREAIGRLAPGERFLAFLQLMDVHNDLWKKPDGPDFGDAPRDLYDNNLASVDRAFERFVAWLKAAGLSHRTVLLFTADHGEQFWEHGASLHGHTVYEEEIRVPLILGAPGLRARVEEPPVLVADMAPTLAELAGYAVRPPYDDPHMGISLVPLLDGGDRAPYRNRDVVGRASFARRYFLYRHWEWKLVYSADFDLLQLFNPVRDPRERTNFVPAEPALAAELERALFAYLDRVEGRTYRPLLSRGSARE